MTQKRPLVSVGMPVYNGEHFLENALNSILAQTFKDFELIISDNGSTDKTEAICRRYANADRRIRYIRNEENLGAGWNFDRVAELATGKYFKWACHDDLCAPEFLQKCVEVLETDPTMVLAYAKTSIIDESGAEIKKYEDGFHLTSDQPVERFKAYHHLVRYGNLCHPFHGTIRREVLTKLLPLGSYPSSDLILLGKLVLYGKFYEIPDYLFCKRDHPAISVRAHRAFHERIAWYDPTKKGKLHLTRWKWFEEYISAIRTAPLTWQEKTKCYRQMLQWLVWNSVWLTKDLLKAIAWPFVKLFLSRQLQFKLPKSPVSVKANNQ
ncbi:glycosyltransferase family 2 protein [Myxosarcina sp. GI1]|uniref:glycosyltransferase family 2 protein n=1 Tax=Myxosarcina sp. GI1 TaxID=1541065 RepID=UPI00055C0752|nr:glycosyltransferase family 2 protein [Myxosarcina sp. GI1]